MGAEIADPTRTKNEAEIEYAYKNPWARAYQREISFLLVCIDCRENLPSLRICSISLLFREYWKCCDALTTSRTSTARKEETA